MDRKTPIDDLRALWQEQAIQSFAVPVAELTARTDGLRRTIAARNNREWIAATVVAVMFAIFAITAETGLARVGHLLEVVAAIYVAGYLRAHGVVRPPGGLPCLAYYRRELERQRDLLRGIWRWYLAPPLPGFFVLVLDRALVASVSVWGVLGFLALFAGVGWINRRAAAELQRQLDALPLPEPTAAPANP